MTRSCECRITLKRRGPVVSASRKTLLTSQLCFERNTLFDIAKPARIAKLIGRSRSGSVNSCIALGVCVELSKMVLIGFPTSKQSEAYSLFPVSNIMILEESVCCKVEDAG